jgi:hypothetical protein
MANAWRASLFSCAPLTVAAFIENADKGKAALLQAIADYSESAHASK